MKAWSKLPNEMSPKKAGLSIGNKSKSSLPSFGKSRKFKRDDDDNDTARVSKAGSKYEEKKLDMEALNMYYEEHMKQEENLSGVLNTKTMSMKNLELKEKIKYWRESKDLRELSDDRIKDKIRVVLEVLEKCCEDMNVDKNKIET